MNKKKDFVNIERKILALLKKSNCFMSVSSISACCNLNINEVKLCLRELRKKKKVVLYHSTRKHKYWGLYDGL